jgi:starch synthase
MANEKIKLLVVASESVPFAKVGGLADVVGALGKELFNKGMDVRIVIPEYTCVQDYIKENQISILNSHEISIPLESGTAKGKVDEINYDGVTYYLIDNPHYFKRDGIYIDSKTKNDYSDSLERFTFFCKSALEAAKIFDFRPDIVQSNDWQTSLVPVYLKTVYKVDPFYKSIKSILLIHNLSYQGIFPVEQFTITGLDWKYFTVNGLEYYGHLNLMKGGIVFSDTVVTVSETYAREIQTAEYGNGLEGITKNKAAQNKLLGIVNGVNYQEWNPQIDIYLKQKYNLNYQLSSFENKKKIKELFLKEHGIVAPNMRKPLIGMISRLVDQKGFDLLFEIIDGLLKDGIYFTLLGTGKYEYETRLKAIKEKYPEQALVFIGFDIPLSHHIEAASDIFLLPSRYEPCGLNQLYSMKYGSVPVVRNTGGLADTVKDGKTGFIFNDYSPEELLITLKKAVELYENSHEKWLKMVETGMNENWSWDRAAQKYLDLYKTLKDS